MKIQIRRSVFETNSSSSHSLSVTSQKLFEEWMAGTVRYIENSDMFVKPEEADYLFENLSDLRESEDVDINDYDTAMTYDQWEQEFETFYCYHTTEHGEKVVAFGACQEG